MRKYIALLLFVFAISPAFASEVKLPPITEDTLDNGLVVVAIENHELPTLSMTLVVRSGSAFDPKGKEGLADFAAGLLRRGTKTRSATQVAEEIDFVGGSLGASADRDAIRAYSGVLTKHLDIGLGLLADIVLNPAFDTSEIDRLKNQVMSGIVQAKDDPNSLCAKGFYEALFDGHPYGHPTEGTEESVPTFTREDIAKFYGDYFHPNNAFLVVAGDVKPADIMPKIAQAFAGWKKAEIPTLQITTPAAPEGYRILLIDKPDATQTQIRFGHFGITRQSPDYYPVMLMNYILGVGFTSRLNEEVRVKGGMTYDIRTTNEWNTLPAAYYCNTFTENDSTMSAIRASIRVIKGMQEKEVGDEEYSDAVNFYAGFYPMTLETPSQVAGEIIKIKLYGLPVSYIQEFTKNIQKVTKADILRAAKTYIDTNNLVFSVVTNAAAVGDSLKALGSVTVVGVDEM